MAVFHDTADSKATTMKNKDVVRCQILGREGNSKTGGMVVGKVVCNPGQIIGAG